MSAREWKPGDVILVNGERGLVQRLSSGSLYVELAEYGKNSGRNLDTIVDRDIRPLVVLDPEDREQVERLVTLWSEAFDDVPPVPVEVDFMQAALREFVDPKPPRPEEPTGLGAVVEDEAGEKHVRAGITHGGTMHDCWRQVTGRDIGYWQRWDRLNVVRVLHEGVQP